MTLEIQNYQAPFSAKTTFNEPFDLVIKKGTVITGVEIETDNYFTVNPYELKITKLDRENPEVNNTRKVIYEEFPVWLQLEISKWIITKAKTKDELIQELIKMHKIQFYKIEKFLHNGVEKLGYQIQGKNGKVYYYVSDQLRNPSYRSLSEFNYLEESENIKNVEVLKSGSDWKELPKNVRKIHLDLKSYDRVSYLYDIALQNEEELIKRYRTNAVNGHKAGDVEIIAIFDENNVQYLYLKQGEDMIPLTTTKLSWEDITPEQRLVHLINVEVKISK